MNKKQLAEKLKNDFKSQDGSLAYSLRPSYWDNYFEQQAEKIIRSQQMQTNIQRINPLTKKRPAIYGSYGPTIEGKNSFEWHSLGVRYSEIGNFQKALDCFENAIALNSKYPESWYGLGYAHYSLKNYPKAIVSFEKVIKLNPSHDLVWFMMGASYNKSENYQEGLKCFKKAIKFIPNNSGVWKGMGESYVNLVRYEEAIKCYKKALDLEPNNDTLFAILGMCYKNLARYLKAIEYYEKALKINPEHEFAKNSLAEINEEMKTLNDNIAKYKNIVKNNPNDEEAWKNLGIYFFYIENNKESINCFEKTIEINPQNILAWMLMGRVYEDLGNIQKAFEYYEKALKINPNHEDAQNLLNSINKKLIWYNKGREHDKSQDYFEAVECYEKAVKDFPNHKESWFYMGVDLAQELEEYDEAIECFKKVINIDPNHKEAHFYLGATYFELEDFEKAIESFVTALKIDPKYKDALYKLGLSYDQLENYPKAIECYQKVIDIDPNYEEVWYEMGLSYENLNDFHKAIECFEKAVKKDPDHEDASKKLNKLQKKIEKQKKKREKELKGLEPIKFEQEKKAINDLIVNYNLKEKNFKIDNDGHVVDLKLNKIKLLKIPQTIGKLTHLKKLHLGDDSITKIEGLETLSQLEELIMGFNDISKIEGLENLYQLRKLMLDYNKIRKIEGLENLSKLEELDLDGNPLLEEDKKIRKKKAQEIVEYCKQLKLKQEDGTLEKEAKERLNQLREKAKKMKNFQKIKFDSEENAILELISEYGIKDKNYKIDKDGHVIELNIKNKGLNEIPKSIGELPYLKVLDLQENNIQKITWLSNLTQLEKLDLGYNQINKINGLENLTQLKFLSFWGNQLSKIEGLDNLTNLEELYLGENEITRIEGLDNLNNLNCLGLDDNPLTGREEEISYQDAQEVVEYCKNIKSQAPLLEKISDEKIEPIEEEKEPTISVKRGGQIQGGKYLFKIKIENNTPYNITNLNFQLISYPEDSINLIGDKFREISKLDAEGSVSPSFEFQPTKDCITGTIHSTVTYIDHLNKPHTINVEPNKISLICGLLQPKKIEINEFIKITQELLNFEKTGEEIEIPYNSNLIFNKIKALLPEENFIFVTSPEEKILGNTFIGEINGFAQGKFNKKEIGVKITVSGEKNRNYCVGMIEAFAQEPAMIPPLISELSEKVICWYCTECKAPINKEDVDKLLKNEPIECKYCGNSITKLNI